MSPDVAADLRAEIARRQIRLYDLAALVGRHPAGLGQMLRGRRPLTPELAERIRQALDAAGQRPAGSPGGGETGHADT